jgi:hypothetical protein
VAKRARGARSETVLNLILCGKNIHLRQRFYIEIAEGHGEAILGKKAKKTPWPAVISM